MNIQFCNWNKFNPRADYISPTWFRFEASILTKPLWDKLSGDEFKAFVALLCLATPSKGNIESNIDTLHRVTGIKPPILISCIKKLQENHIVALICTDSVQMPNGSVQMPNGSVADPCATNERTNERTHVAGAPVALHWLGILWNQNCGNLPKIKEISQDRLKHIKARLSECEDPEIWKEAIRRIAASSFCNGGGAKGWRANFDSLIKSGTRIKAIEGQYDDKHGNNQSKEVLVMKGRDYE